MICEVKERGGVGYTNGKVDPPRTRRRVPSRRSLGVKWTPETKPSAKPASKDSTRLPPPSRIRFVNYQAQSKQKPRQAVDPANTFVN